jgi:penicillin-binding protein-related factor A (putative recombinase)
LVKTEIFYIVKLSNDMYTRRYNDVSTFDNNGFHKKRNLRANERDLYFRIGSTTGYPGVFQGNPHPYPWEPAPTQQGRGFNRHGSWV